MEDDDPNTDNWRLSHDCQRSYDEDYWSALDDTTHTDTDRETVSHAGTVLCYCLSSGIQQI